MKSAFAVFRAHVLASALVVQLVALLVPLVLPGTALATPRTSQAGNPQQGVYLVFPFENRGASPHLDWLGEGLEELAIQRLSAAGESVYSHSGRMNELERYGLPATAKLSRATMLRIAEDLDADYVVLGSFASDGTQLTVELRVLRVGATKLLAPIRESGPLDSLMDVATKLAWRTVSSSGRSYPLSLAEFSKKQRPVRLDAFEHYIRGLIAADDDARLRNLRESARLEPEWPDPDFALGELYFAHRDCNAALPWFARVPRNHDRSVEAMFSTGVCQLLLKQPDKAEETFVAIQQGMRKDGASGADLPELLNNLALARAAAGKIPEANQDLRKATEMDPDEDDYPFNQGVLSLRAGDTVNAAGYFREAAARKPDNAEDRAFLIFALEKAGKKTEADEERVSAEEAFGPKALPAIHWDVKDTAASAKLDRIKTELDTTQLQLELKSPETSSASGAGAVAGSQTPADWIRRGRQNLAAGQIPDADRAFRSALASDPGNSAAHRGLAEVHRRQGKLDDAVKELQSSLQARDSAVVRTTLARTYLEQKKPELARTELEKALKLAPNYSEAKQLLERMKNSKPSENKPNGGAR